MRDEVLNCDSDLPLMARQPSGMLMPLVEASGDEIRGLESLILKARVSETLAVELRRFAAPRSCASTCSFHVSAYAQTVHNALVP